MTTTDSDIPQTPDNRNFPRVTSEFDESIKLQPTAELLRRLNTTEFKGNERAAVRYRLAERLVITVDSETDPFLSLHNTLGHRNPRDTLAFAARNNIAIGTPAAIVCDVCQRQGHRRSNTRADTRPRDKFETFGAWAMDTYGPQENGAFGTGRFYLGAIDRATRYLIVIPMASTSAISVQQAVRRFATEARRLIDDAPKDLSLKLGPNITSDSAGYFKSDATQAVLRAEGFTNVSFTAPYTPTRNGLIERAWGTIFKSMRCMLDAAGLSDDFHVEATQHAVRIYNYMPTANLNRRSPYECAFGRSPDISTITRVAFGAPVWAHRHVRSKKDQRGIPAIYLGWDDTTRAAIVAYRTPKTHLLVKTSTAHFTADTRLPAAVLRGQVDHLPDDLTQSDEIFVTVEDNTLGLIGYVDGVIDHPDAAARGIDPAIIADRSSIPDLIGAIRDRTVYYSEAQAMRSPNGALFKGALDEEINGLLAMGALQPIAASDLTPEELDNAQTLMHIFNVKRDEKGNLKGKARLVYRGSQQVRHRDYDEKSSSTPRWTTLRTHLGMIPTGDPSRFTLSHVDLKKFFAHCPNWTPTGARVIARLPSSAKITQDGVTYDYVELPRALYGQVNASFLAQQYLFKCFRDNGWTQTFDPCAWVKGDSRIVVWIDDIVVRATPVETQRLVEQLDKVFPGVKMSPCDFLLGHHVRRTDNGSYSLSAQQYITDLMDRFDIRTTVDTPMVAGYNPATDTEGEALNDVDTKTFQSIIGACLHLSNTSRPDISFATATLGQVSHAPTKQHLKQARRVLQYLRGTLNLGIVFTHPSDPTHVNKVTAYVDASYADSEGFRSQTGFAIMYNGAPIAWTSRTQRFVTTSSQEAEVVAAADVCKEIVFIKQLLDSWDCETWRCKVTAPITVYEDNQGCVAWFTTSTMTARTKHYNTRLFYIRDLVKKEKLIQWQYISTSDQTADVLTKSLAKSQQRHHTDKLMREAYHKLVINLVAPCYDYFTSRPPKRGGARA
jgi:hypothetical protein